MPKLYEELRKRPPPKPPKWRNSFEYDSVLFRAFADAIPQALWICELDTVRYVNPSWRILTGRLPVAGDSVAKLYATVHPEDRQCLLNEFCRFPRAGADFECRLLRPDGRVLWVRTRTFSVEGFTEHPLLAGLMEEVTVIRDEAKSVERRMSDFILTVSHELRTPLTSISGSLGLLAGNATWQSPPAAERLLSIAYANSKRLIRIVNDILDIERIESGNVVFDVKRVGLNTLVAQAIEANQGFAKSCGVGIRLRAAASDCEVEVDPDRFMQVLTNLLSNAAKFSPPSKDVDVRIDRDAASVTISIRDRGPGIPEELKPHIFEKFARAKSSEPHQKEGTGLGLSIAKRIVNRLGGTLSFADAPGGGAIFSVELPVAMPLVATTKRGPNGPNKKEVI